MSYTEHQKHGHAVRAHVRVGVLTVSDSRTPLTDDSGKDIEALAKKAGHEVSERMVVADDVEKIRAAFESLLRARPDVVLVNGGTGIAPRDVTPEAIRPLLVKELPGFGERFRALSADQVGTGAWLSRATAGTLARNATTTVVFLLPGSPAACRLAVERLILPELSHVVSLAQGVRPDA